MPSSSTANHLTYKPGSVIFEEGQSGDAVYLIVGGKVEIRIGSHGGNPRTFATCSKGEVIGEIALFDDQAHLGTAVAIENTTVVAMSREEFRKLVDAMPPVIRGIVLLMVKRFRENFEWVKPQRREVNLANWKPEKKK